MEWVAALATIVVAIIEAMAARDRRHNKRDREKAEKRAAIRAEESRLSMEMMSATCALALVTAKKMAGVHTNGDVEEAMNKAKEAQEEYAEFVRKLASAQVGKAA